jgi:hypothetical protein
VLSIAYARLHETEFADWHQLQRVGPTSLASIPTTKLAEEKVSRPRVVAGSPHSIVTSGGLRHAGFRREQNKNQIHSMQGNHIAGVATPASGAQQVEMWHGRMDANSATPPLSVSPASLFPPTC